MRSNPASNPYNFNSNKVGQDNSAPKNYQFKNSGNEIASPRSIGD